MYLKCNIDQLPASLSQARLLLWVYFCVQGTGQGLRAHQVQEERTDKHAGAPLSRLAVHSHNAALVRGQVRSR